MWDLIDVDSQQIVSRIRCGLSPEKYENWSRLICNFGVRVAYYCILQLISSSSVLPSSAAYETHLFQSVFHETCPSKLMREKREIFKSLRVNLLILVYALHIHSLTISTQHTGARKLNGNKLFISVMCIILKYMQCQRMTHYASTGCGISNSNGKVKSVDDRSDYFCCIVWYILYQTFMSIGMSIQYSANWSHPFIIF